MEHHATLGDKQYVTMTWMVGTMAERRAPRWHHTLPQQSSSCAASAPSTQQHHSQWFPELRPLLPRGLERLPWRTQSGGGCGVRWQPVVAAAVLGANMCALAYLVRWAWNTWIERHDRQRVEDEQQEVTRAALAYLQRLWDVALKTSTAGPPPDLGQPDAEGVYTYEGQAGARLYFRLVPQQANGGGGGGGGRGGEPPQMWQWSTSRRLWLPTSAADSIWCDSGDNSSSPGLGGRLLIRRLELESQLLYGARCSAARAAAEPLDALPPLELPAFCQGSKLLNGGSADSTTLNNGAAALAALLADIPDSFLCPLSQRIMTDPVVTPGGVTYDRGALLDWIQRHGTDPITGRALAATQPYPNLNLRDQICGFFLVREYMPDV